MKKRILCVIMSMVMVAGVMTGCGSKDTSSKSENVSDSGAGNKSVDSENVSDNLEAQYVERMEAYLEYFQNEEKDYDGVVGTSVVLDTDSLPLLWLAFAESGDRGEDMRFQLCSYDKDKVNVLAEKKINDVYGAYPYLGMETIGMQLEFDNGDGADPAALIYDSEEQDFKFYDKDYFENADYFNSSNYKNEDDIEDNYQAMMNDLDVYQIFNGQLKFFTLINNGKVAYLGQLDENDIYFDYLDTLGALDSSVKSDAMGARKLSDDFKDNEFVSNIYNKYFSNYLLQPTIYLPDGTETDLEGVWKYYDIAEKTIANEDLLTAKDDYSIRFVSDMDAEAVMRRLIKHPAYTAFDVLIAYQKELGDSDYEVVEVKEIIEDVINNNNNSVDPTESTESTYREDSTEVSQQTNNSDTFEVSAYSTDITKFEMNNNILDVETVNGDKWIYPVADNCSWYDGYYVDDSFRIGNLWEYDDLKDRIDSEREMAVANGEYDSPIKLNISIEQGQVICVYTIMS